MEDTKTAEKASAAIVHALHILSTERGDNTPLAEVFRERHAQIEVYKHTMEHDLSYGPGVLTDAALSYLMHYRALVHQPTITRISSEVEAFYPFGMFTTPASDRSTLIAAMAMILAEIDRIDLEEVLGRAGIDNPDLVPSITR